MNKAGCLDRCENGPVMVVYPEGIWYTMVDQEDVDEIIEKFKARFPGLNAFFESGDEQALATLRQQLKEHRETSNSIGSSS